MLRIDPDTGRTYCMVARDAAGCARAVQRVLEHPMAEVVPHAGGLLVGLSVLENIVLPAVYHGRVTVARLTDLVYQAFENCGIGRHDADALSRRTVADLDDYERRLVAFVRSLVMHPPLLIFERIFEGLTAADTERVARFATDYRRMVAGGTVVYANLAGMACPELATDARAEPE